ncbi:major capsid protein [Paraburkholderia rhizosphaerae]|uniref:Virion coat protein B n=1 Tax=Paraburkholderia rhizosphaerae TaxID=480658 RepID=A0A4V3HEG7_9BURK|nr:major capsid protein [Paraburkholderia rhizosphaerae]TDY47719.1 virion coat protein B [Paraburkholderia rhizosphaerae]
MKGLKAKLAVIAAGAAASTGAFAQASGVDVTPIVTAINGTIPSIVAIGGAVLAVVVVAWGYKTVRGFLGR